MRPSRPDPATAGDRPPRIRRRTFADKLLRFARNVLLGLIATLLVGWLILIVAAPVVVHGKMRMNAEPRIEPIAAGGLPAELEDSYRHLVAGLAGEGFEEVGWFQIEELTPDTVTYMGFARNDDERVIGYVAGIVNRLETGDRLGESYLELSTELRDGREVMTNNSNTPSPFHPRPERLVAKFADVGDPLELYRIHLERLHELGQVARRPLPTPDRLSEHIERDLIEDLEGQVEEGYFFLDAANACYRPTWKGAILMTWKQIWPLSKIL